MGSKLRSIQAWMLFALILIPVWATTRIEGAWHARRGTNRDGLRRRVARGLSLYAHLSPLYEFRIEGLENIPLSGPYVLVANHESFLDPLCLFLLHTPARIVSHQHAAQIPVVGSLFRWCEHIGVDPSDAASRHAALDDAERSLQRGTAVAIFPEGRMPLPGKGMSEFRRGAFVAARRGGVPIVPVVLIGTGAAWAPGTVVVHGRHRIVVRVLPPVPAEAVARTSPEELAREVRDRMVGHHPFIEDA